MRRSVNLVIELFRVGQRQVVFHRLLVSNPHEIVVPGALRRNHEESEESIREKHLNFLVVAGQVTLRVVALVCVVLAPLEATRRKFVGRQGA